MKRHRRKIVGPRVQFIVTEAYTPALQVFFCYVQGMQDRTLYRINLCQRSP